MTKPVLVTQEEGESEWTYGHTGGVGGRYGSAWKDGTVYCMGDKVHKVYVAKRNTYNQAIRALRAYLKGHRP